MERMERTKQSGFVKGGWLRPNILTNDPSMTAWGWAVLDSNGTVQLVGAIKTAPEQKKRRIRKSDDTTRRASEIIKELLYLIKRYNIQYILSESPHGSQNASAAVMIGMVAGIMQTLADVHDIGIEWYSEGDSKKALLGKLSATKRETINAISKLYTVPWSGVQWKDEAIADALSIHYCATKNSSTLKLMNK
jgi:Holliday junction resolvasome RuvABC endonuclease subunit